MLTCDLPGVENHTIGRKNLVHGTTRLGTKQFYDTVQYTGAASEARRPRRFWLVWADMTRHRVTMMRMNLFADLESAPTIHVRLSATGP